MASTQNDDALIV